MRKYMLSALGLAATLGILVSCEKGDDGPQGPAGNANVIYSDWFRPATYQKDTVFGIWGFKHNQPAPEITQAVLDSAAILTFGKLAGYNAAVWPAGTVAPLPITITYMQGGLQNDTWHAFAKPGNLQIKFQNDHNIYSSIATAHEFRYVIIPAGADAGRAAQLSYQEICQRYGIPE